MHACMPWSRTLLVGQGRQLVDVLARVDGVGDDEAKVEVEGLDEAVLEEMALNHAEAVDGQIAGREFDAVVGGLQDAKTHDR